MNKLWVFLFFLCFFMGKTAHSQLIEQTSKPSNKLALPFLLVSRDAVSSGMGEAGSALLMSNSTAESNTAKAGFLDGKFGANLTYTPWLKELVSDRKLMFVGGYFKLDSKISFTASLNYLSYGQIDLIDMNQISLGMIKPTEYVGGVGISKQFGSKFSLGMKVKIIHSNLYSSNSTNVAQQVGTAYCVDLSSYHIFPVNLLYESKITLALNLENIGPKISYYSQAGQSSFLPANLKIATAFNTLNTANDEWGIGIDFNKLLVPKTQLDAQASVLGNIVSSFDAFGIGDMSLSLGTEYCYRKTLAFRAGYNLQGDERSPGSSFSVGMGIKQKKVVLNIAYITGNAQRTFLSNTMRLSLGYSM